MVSPKLTVIGFRYALGVLALVHALMATNGIEAVAPA